MCVCTCADVCAHNGSRGPSHLWPHTLASSSHRRGCSCTPAAAEPCACAPSAGNGAGATFGGAFFWVGSHAGSSTCERGRGSYVVTNRCGKQTALGTPPLQRHDSQHCDISVSARAVVAHQTPTAQVSHRRAVTGVSFFPKRGFDSNYNSLNGGRITINRYFHSFLSPRIRHDYKMQFV